jgi:hypothetical protein
LGSPKHRAPDLISRGRINRDHGISISMSITTTFYRRAQCEKTRRESVKYVAAVAAEQLVVFQKRIVMLWHCISTGSSVSVRDRKQAVCDWNGMKWNGCCLDAVWWWNGKSHEVRWRGYGVRIGGL